MQPIHNIVYHIQFVTIFCILDLQVNTYLQIKKTCYMSAGFAGGHVVGFGDLSMDVFLEVQNKRYTYICYLIVYTAHGLHFGMKCE